MIALASAHPIAYLFGAYRLDPVRRLLARGTAVIPLPERLYELLILLIQANGTVVSKETLAREIWPSGGMTDGNLWQHVYMLRQILGESARDRSYVMTVSGKGYRLAVPVSVEAPESEFERPHSLSHAEETPLLASGAEAFRFYTGGSYQLEKRTAPALRRAIAYFEGALLVDPDYTPALVGLARAFALLAVYGYVPVESAFPKAKIAIVRALEHNPGSASAHAVLAEMILFGEWDWNAAQRELDVACALDSTSIYVRNNAACMHVFRGEPEKALIEVQHALVTEPGSPFLQTLVGRIFSYMGEQRRAIDYFTAILDGGPEFESARRHRAQALILAGEPEEAIADLQLLPDERAENLAIRLPLLGRAYADAGQTERADETYRFLTSAARTEYVLQTNLALVAAGLGAYDVALDHLDAAVQRREPALMTLRSTHYFAPIERTARYRDILRSIGPTELRPVGAVTGTHAITVH